MPRYVFTAKDAGGQTLQESVDAESAEAAQQILRERGLLELVLVTSDALSGAIAPAGRPPDHAEARSDDARSRVSFADAKGRSGRVLAATRLLFGQLWWLTAFGALLFLWLRWGGRPVGGFDLLALLLVGAPLGLAALTQLFGPGETYAQLLQLLHEARWEAALELLPRLERSLGPMVVGLYRARCLAGLGRVEEAYRLAESLRPPQPSKLTPYLAQLGPVYDAAHDPTRHIAVLEEALTVAADKAVFQLDLALVLVLRRRDPLGARRYLDASKGATLPAHSGFARPLIAALIALEDGRLLEAKELLIAAQVQLAPHLGKSPTLESMRVLVCYAEALVLAGLGDLVGARRSAKVARPYLEAHGDRASLDRLREAGL